MTRTCVKSTSQPPDRTIVNERYNIRLQLHNEVYSVVMYITEGCMILCHMLLQQHNMHTYLQYIIQHVLQGMPRTCFYLFSIYK